MIRRILHLSGSRLVIEINRLLPQLFSSGKGHPAHFDDIDQALGNRNFSLFVAEHPHDPGRVIGMAIILFQWKLSGWEGYIHDVVVDKPHRREGIGDALTEKLLKTAQEFSRKQQKAMTLFLTSKPEREAANTMYLKHGFELVARAVGENGRNLYQKTITP